MLSMATAGAGNPTTSASLSRQVAVGAFPATGRDLMLAWRMPLFVGVTLMLGVLSHLSAVGTTGAVPGLIVSFGALVATWSLVANREQSPSRLLLLVWLSQLEVHLGLTLPYGSALHHHDGPASVRMVGSHAVAGLLVALWLRRGEAFAWRAARRLGRLLGGQARPSGVVTPAIPAVVDLGANTARRTCWLTADPRRGPPRGRSAQV